MARRTVPKYSLHKATGQARVRINGRDIYLGVFGSAESHNRYSEELAKWHRSNRDPVSDVTIATLTKLYLTHCREYYVKGGKVTGEVNCIRIALRHLNQLYRTMQAREFDSLAMMAVRERMIEQGYVRRSINHHMSRIRGLFKWAAKRKLVTKNVWLDLLTVEGLKIGRSKAVEPEPVTTVPDAYIDAVKPFVTSPVWGMIELQRWTGMRPGEVVKLRGIDLKMFGDVWEYHVPDHKTEHHGKKRIVMIGQKGQAILQEFLTNDLTAFVFNPQHGRSEFAKRNYRSGSKSAVRNGKNCYAVTGYSSSISRACQKAGVPHWTPNQLRHNFATLAK